MSTQTLLKFAEMLPSASFQCSKAFQIFNQGILLRGLSPIAPNTGAGGACVLGPGHVAKAEHTEGPSGSQPLIAHPIFEVVDSQATISPAP